jgi:hydrogenase maturation protein HypF
MKGKKIRKNRWSAIEIVVFGVVQGVGFRPFVYLLAHELGYSGWVKNIGFGVKIRLEKEGQTDFEDFLKALRQTGPPLAQIENITTQTASPLGLEHFEIKKSKQEKSFVFISPDISVCENCQKEMMTPSNRRYRYPFINCTDCGPRYTIVKDLPYDRKQTTMKNFPMCSSCQKEYSHPLDRRYHAQPVACPVCGPQVQLVRSRTRQKIKGGVKKAASLIKQGKILAVKGLGGFHLVCDALNQTSVARLRKIKERKVKPFALMAKNLEVIEIYARIDSSERELLLSARRPIVLLRKRLSIKGIAPHLNEMGFMLPYTPLHYLLLEDIPLIVATSSNKKDAPIMKEEDEGIDDLCDYILTHNRPIQTRADDSVMKAVSGKPLFIRRARGYVPYPQKVPAELSSSHHILALGGELKDTISLHKSGYVITSQFLGDLDEYQNYQYFEETLLHLTKLFAVDPKVVVSDLHPDFHTTRYAQRYARKMRIPHLKIQHHFAHMLAPLLEHSFPPGEKVLGVALDGYGYGDDGTAWGGEFLLADYAGYKRYAHFAYVPLPGGDLAAKQPWRMALSYLGEAFGKNLPLLQSLKKVNPKKIQGVQEMIRQKINTPLTSSCGRLFDAVSFLTGCSPLEMEFEAEAPMRLEAAAEEGTNKKYAFAVIPDAEQSSCRYGVFFNPTIKAIVKDLMKETPAALISAKFHNTIAHVIDHIAEKARMECGIDSVVLIGGVFLNKVLLQTTQRILERKGFSVYRPIQYSPNDESISVGQIAYALNSLQDRQGTLST